MYVFWNVQRLQERRRLEGRVANGYFQTFEFIRESRQQNLPGNGFQTLGRVDMLVIWSAISVVNLLEKVVSSVMSKQTEKKLLPLTI